MPDLHELMAAEGRRCAPETVPPFEDILGRANRRRTRRAAAATSGVVVVVVVVVLVAMLGGWWLQPSTVTGSPTAGLVAPSLAAVLAEVTVPVDAVPLVGDPVQPDLGKPPIDRPSTFRQASQYWTTSASPQAVVAAFIAHPPAGSQPSDSGHGRSGANLYWQVSFAWPQTDAVQVQVVEVSAVRLPTGRTQIAVTAWQVLRPAKPSELRVSGAVSTVTITQDGRVATTLTGAAAQQLTAGFNALLVEVAYGHLECGQSQTLTRLTFHTSTGDQVFNDGCRTIGPATGPTTSLVLEPTDAYTTDLAFALPQVVPSPSVPTGGLTKPSLPAGTLTLSTRPGNNAAAPVQTRTASDAQSAQITADLRVLQPLAHVPSCGPHQDILITSTSTSTSTAPSTQYDVRDGCNLVLDGDQAWTETPQLAADLAGALQ